MLFVKLLSGFNLYSHHEDPGHYRSNQLYCPSGCETAIS